MTEKSTVRSYYRDGVGRVALIVGIVALLCAFVPFVGDFVAVPAGVVAVGCGWIGLGRAIEGTASNSREAVLGASLGGAALFMVFLTFAASYM